MPMMRIGSVNMDREDVDGEFKVLQGVLCYAVRRYPEEREKKSTLGIWIQSTSYRGRVGLDVDDQRMSFLVLLRLQREYDEVEAGYLITYHRHPIYTFTQRCDGGGSTKA